jgi:hypothetical protein
MWFAIWLPGSIQVKGQALHASCGPVAPDAGIRAGPRATSFFTVREKKLHLHQAAILLELIETPAISLLSMIRLSARRRM